MQPRIEQTKTDTRCKCVLFVQDSLSPHVSVFLSDVETDIWPSGTVTNLTQQSARWLITRGELGADEFTHSGMHHFPPYKVRCYDLTHMDFALPYSRGLHPS